MIHKMENKRAPLRILGFALVILFIIAAMWSLVCKGSSISKRGSTPMKTKQFVAQNPALDFTFAYPENGWIPTEAQGSAGEYDLVYLRGPVNKEVKFSTLIHVTVKPLKQNDTAANLLEAYLRTDSNLSKFKVLHKGPRKIGGINAAEAFYEYESFPLYDMRAKPVFLRGTRVYLIRKDRSYEFEFEALASEYDAYVAVLEEVLKTVEFKN